MSRNVAVILAVFAACCCSSTNAAGLRTRARNGICAAETAAVTAAHDKVVSAEKDLQQANAEYEQILKTCNTYHFAEIKQHPECPQDKEDKGRYNEIVTPAANALDAAKADQEAAQKTLNDCDPNAYERTQDSDNLKVASDEFTANNQREHDELQKRVTEANKAEDAQADAAKNAKNAARAVSADTLTDLLAEITKQLIAEQEAIDKLYAADEKAFSAALSANKADAENVKKTQLHALESQVEFRTNEEAVAAEAHTVALQELTDAQILNDQMVNAANFARDTLEKETSAAESDRSDCRTAAKTSFDRQKAAADAQDEINEEFFNDQVAFVNEIRDYLTKLQSGVGAGDVSRFDNEAEEERRATAEKADLHSAKIQEKRRSYFKQYQERSAKNVRARIEGKQKKFGNPPDQPILSPDADCEEQNSAGSFVCYETSEGALYTFASDCQATFFRDNSAKSVSQGKSEFVGKHYESLEKVHGGSCTQIDTKSDSLQTDYEATGAGEAAQASVAARRAQEADLSASLLSLRQRIRLTSLVHKYVKEDRSALQNGKILEVLQRIEDRIEAERKKASDAHEADVKRLEGQLEEENGVCQSNYEETITLYTELKETAEAKEVAAAAKLTRKTKKETTAKARHDEAARLLTEAQNTLEKQTPIIEEAYNRRVKEANDAYEMDLQLATDKHTRDSAYIGEERDTILAVQELVNKIGNVQEQRGVDSAAATEKVTSSLLDVAERITSKRVYRLASRNHLRRKRYDIESDRADEEAEDKRQENAEAARKEEDAAAYRSTLAERGVEDSDLSDNIAEEDFNSLDNFKAQDRYNDKASGSRDGETAYTEYKMRNSDAMKQVRLILDELDENIRQELAEVGSRKSANDERNTKNRDKLLERAGEILNQKKTAFEEIVKTAKANHNDALTKKTITAEAADAAAGKKQVATATLEAVQKTSTDDIERYSSEKQTCEDKASATARTDRERIDLQKREALEYLAQEKEVVNKIKEVLSGLNLEFVGTDVGGSSYSTLLQTGKRVRLTAEQESAIKTLQTLAGKLDPRDAYIDSSNHDAKGRIAELLQHVEDTLKNEESRVQNQHEEDVATIARELKAQSDRCDSVFAHQKAESERRVSEATAAKTHAVQAFNSASQAAEAAAADEVAKGEAHQGRLDDQKRGNEIAELAHTADTEQANQEYARRRTEIAAEAEADRAYLEASQQAISGIRSFIGDESAFLQVASMHRATVAAKAATGAIGTYIEHSSGSAKDKINALLTKIENHLQSEIDRVNKEHDADTARLQEERESQDEEATFNRDDDLKMLQEVRDHAEKAKEEADKALNVATQEHLKVSKHHNYNMDTLETAKQIQKTNLPVFTSDRDRTLELANYVFQQENEIIEAKRAQADFYLSTEQSTLNEIAFMLTDVNILNAQANRFEKQTNNFDSKAAKAAGIWNLAHNAKTWNKINMEEATREREIGDDYSNTERSDVDDHELTNFRGEKVKFDDAGELVSEPNTDFIAGKTDLDVSAKTSASKVDADMINAQAREALEGRARAALLQVGSRRGLSPRTSTTTLGNYLNEVRSEVEREQGRVKVDFKEEMKRISSTRNSLVKKARDIFKRETEEDQKRVDEAQVAHDTSLEELNVATATKAEATKVAIQKAAILRDAIATQQQRTPEINAMYEERMAHNKKSHEASQASIDASKKDALAYLAKEQSVIAEVRPLIEGMDKSGVPSALLQVVHKVVRRTLQRIASKRYDFDVRKSADYVDRQEESYMNKGDQGTGASTYKNIFTKKGGINAVIEGLRNELKAEITKVAERHKQELKELTQARDKAISVSLEKKRKAQQKLRQALNKAVEAHHITSHDLEQQQGAFDTAYKMRARKESILARFTYYQGERTKKQTKTYGDKVAAAKKSYSEETTEFKNLKSESDRLIAQERENVAQIRAFANNDLSAGPEEEASVDTCENEKEALDSAKARAAHWKAECTRDQIAAAGEEDEYRAESNVCEKSSAASAGLASASSAYQKCIAKSTGSAFVSVKMVKRSLRTLKKKYIDRDTEAEKSNDIGVLNKLLDEIENKIDGEEDKAQKTFDKDMSDSKAKLDAELTRAKKRLETELADAKALVATAQEGYNVAKKEEDTQKLILDDKKSKDDAAEAAQDAAQASVNLNFPLLEQESQNSIQAANQEFLNRKTEADAIKASDTEYLESEISTVDEVQKLLSQLNARGGGSSSF